MDNDRRIGLVGLAAAALLAWNFSAPAPTPSKPNAPNAPTPKPPPRPEPKPKPKPWGLSLSAPVGAKVGGATNEDGTELQCDLPGALHQKNKGGRDGAGLCVFTSIAHAAHWQNVPLLEDFRDWMTKHPGGGYPEKVTKMIEQIAKEKGQPVPDYLQVQNNDLEILKAACASGRMPGVTYSSSPTGRYRGRIAHMVSLVHADDRWFVILDNNYPGADKYEWMSPEEFIKTYSGGRTGWAVILLNPPPPPPPRN